MKVIVAGKGGSGKSTLCALMARQLAKQGWRILLVDADESNMGLHRMVGMPENPVLMDQLGGKKGFKQKMNPPPLSLGESALFGDRVTLDTLQKEWVAEHEGISLLSIGKIHVSGEGCACPMGALSRLVLSKLVIGGKELVVIDTTAGIEHFGRGIDEKCDLVLIVVDPSQESFALAKKIVTISTAAGLDYAVILNKVSDQVRDIMLRHVEESRVIAEVSHDDRLFLNNLNGEPLSMEIGAIAAVCGFMENKALDQSNH